MLLLWAVQSSGILDSLPSSWPSVSAGGLVALVVLLILTGQLVPGRTHRSEIADLRAQVEAERKARERWEEAALRALGQNDQLMPGVKVTRQIAEAALPPVDRGGP